MRRYLPAGGSRLDNGDPLAALLVVLASFAAVYTGVLWEGRVSHNAAQYARDYAARYPRAGLGAVEGVLCAGRDGDGDGLVACRVYYASGAERALKCSSNIFWETDRVCVEGGFRPVDVGSEQ